MNAIGVLIIATALNYNLCNALEIKPDDLVTTMKESQDFDESATKFKNVMTQMVSMFMGNPKKNDSDKAQNDIDDRTQQLDTATLKVTEPPAYEEPAPQDTFAVRDENGKICILAKFGAKFTIKYKTTNGDQTINTEMPIKVRQRGTCSKSKKSPTLEVLWPGFRFKFTFNQKEKCTNEKSKKCWGIRSLALSYNTSTILFVDVKKPQFITIRSDEEESYFEAPTNRSYVCPSPEVVPLYNSGKTEKGTVRFTDMQIQPYKIKNGVFSIGSRCSQVSYGFGPEPYVDKTVPIAAGSTLAVLTLLIIIGYGIKRSIHNKRVQYSNME